MNNNSILASTNLPSFSNVPLEQIEPALDEVLQVNREQIKQLLSNNTAFTWENLIAPLEMLANNLARLWSPIRHLHAVATSDALRAVYRNGLDKLTTYHTEMEQNETLYAAFQTLAQSTAYTKLNGAQQKVIQNELRDFHLAGVDLAPAHKKRYAEIQTRLAELATQFEEHVLDATEAWTKHIVDYNDLAGIPTHVIDTAQKRAQQKNLSGWVFTLEFPCYQAIMAYSTQRELREEMYHAYTTRASDQGPQANQFDNTAIMHEILALKQELSHLLGFATYAHYSLATKMVKNPEEALSFLQQLAIKAKPHAIQELNELKQFAYERDSITKLESWDIAYYSEQLRQMRYHLTDEMLRPYFPIDRVLHGLFEITHRLYNVQIQEEKNVNVWHPDVRFFSIRDKNGAISGQFYLDLYARPKKQSGAWMDEYCQRWRTVDGKLQIPVAYLTCNLTAPTDTQPALLTHDEVTTLFHEFGHGLHHLLTKIDYLNVSGISGVAWDAVELPSQFMEFFAWEPAGIQLISGHYQTNEVLPEALLQALRNSKNFHSGLALLRQLEFGLFDFKLHLNSDAQKGKEQIQAMLEETRQDVAVIQVPPWNRMAHSFSHIFAGGYAAGYYSYLWAEMLACDAFAKFKEEGIFNPAVSTAFLQHILEQGGAQDALELFVAFRGRPPVIEPLLDHWGI
jgi:oligopeptidase A